MMKISVESESSDIFGHAFKTINQPSRISQASLRSLSACLLKNIFLSLKNFVRRTTLTPSELHNNGG